VRSDSTVRVKLPHGLEKVKHTLPYWLGLYELH